MMASSTSDYKSCFDIAFVVFDSALSVSVFLERFQIQYSITLRTVVYLRPSLSEVFI